MLGLGTPVALSIKAGEEWMWVRYICPQCRRVWERGFTMNFDPTGTMSFEDRFIHERERLRAPQDEGLIGPIPFPQGPAEFFERR
ncbi:MAG: hypothetical protein GEU28_08905 [Dehalococcoidia bacterium]|nr:hypothetical protein [Dehalococcoidia bacterium]